MKLIRTRVTDYRSIDDSGWVDVDNVTCLVGKNESGKTAFLGALRKLNPVAGVNGDFDLKDYPRKGYVGYRRKHKTDPATVVRAEFRIEDAELRVIEAEYGEGVLPSSIVTVSKDYSNARTWSLKVDEAAHVRHILGQAVLPPEMQERAQAARTVDELRAVLEAVDIKPPAVSDLLMQLRNRPQAALRDQIVTAHLKNMMPAFVYFDDYSAMRGRISIPALRRRSIAGELDDADRTFLSLISLVGADLEDLESQTNYEHIKAELESASINITDKVFEYWSQSAELRVDFDLSNANSNDPPPLNEGTILHVRIFNNRHRVSVSFDERSKGFVWFFSFLSYFSSLELEDEDRGMLLLFDEPGLNLHATGQVDFLRFIDEQLAPRHQVVYTTHSPFMIDLDRLGSLRTVQDIDERGTVVSDDVVVEEPETIFPLQVAIGYRLARSLFRAPHCLLVDSPSDQIFLRVLGEAVAARGHAPLDPRWVTIPVGGADNLPTYLSLLGDGYANVAVMMDVTPKSKACVQNINNRAGGAGPVRTVEVAKIRDADLEDLFPPELYLELVNGAYAGRLPRELTMSTISGPNPRIAQRIQALFEREKICDGQFDRYRPAVYLLQRHAELRDRIDDSSIERAASMFDRVNALLPAAKTDPAPHVNGADASAALAYSSGHTRAW